MASKAYIVTDLSYGDAGKGTTVDFLSRQVESSLVVRFNGASQAAHNVITPDGSHHVFSQFGSGSFSKGSLTFLSRYMLINPLNMVNEANHLIELGLSDIWKRTYVDTHCQIITPWHEATNRIKEVLRDKNRHGSCGHGIGEAVKDNIDFPELTIRVRDITGQKNQKRLFKKLKAIRNHKFDQLLKLELLYNCNIEALNTDIFISDSYIDKLLEGYAQWSRAVQYGDVYTLSKLSNDVDRLIFEGSQGVLLDEYYGFYPYTTWSTTTAENALELLDEIEFDGETIKLGLIRAYTTRHGAGPFVTEDNSLNNSIEEKHNTLGNWQGAFRMGWLDLVAHKYAVEANGGIDALVICGLDQISEIQNVKVCTSYDVPEDELISEMYTPLIDTGHGLRLGNKSDISSREKLAISLEYVTPNFVDFFKSDISREESMIELIETYLESKVLIKSYGPSSKDKIYCS